MHQLAFHRRPQDADPGPLLRSARDDRVELLPDPRLQQERGGRFPHLALDLVRPVLRLGAVLGQLLQFRVCVRGRAVASAAFKSRCAIRSGKRRLGAVEWV